MEYFSPNFIDEALVVLDRYGARARVLAGGTILGQQLRADATDAAALVNVKRIRELGEIRVDGDDLSIGALVTAHALAADPHVRAHAPLVAQAAASMGAPALRSCATIGGNLLSGHHAADLVVALLACDARARMTSLRDGDYELPVERMASPGFGGLGAGALLTTVRVPHQRGHGGFAKFQTRRAFELALVSAAVVLEVQERTIVDARVALGGAAPTPIRAVAAEAVLRTTAVNDAAAFEKAADAAAHADAEPHDDARASAAFRRHLVRVLAGRAIRAALR